MSTIAFQIIGLDPTPFLPLYGQSDEELKEQGVYRLAVRGPGAFPDRVSLTDGLPGQHMLLLNHRHLPKDSPYAASYAIFVREGATVAARLINRLPESWAGRQLALRAFDARQWLIDARVVDASEAAQAIGELLANDRVEHLQAHYAAPGCYAARIERLEPGDGH